MPDTLTDSTASVGSTAPSSDSGSTPTQGTAEPSSAGTTTQPATPPGPVPYERFEQINTKYKNLAWAEAHDPQRVQQQQAWFEWVDRDPVGAFRYLEDYLSRAGVPIRPQAAIDNGKDQRPQPDVIVPETGQKFYSAEAAEKLAKWQAEQLLNERVSPLEQQLQSLNASQGQQQAHAEAQRLLAEAETWPHYKDHEPLILKEMERDHRLSLEGAYRRVVMPKLRELERQVLVQELNEKRAASTVNPGTASPTERQAISKMSWSDAFRTEMAKKR